MDTGIPFMPIMNERCTTMLVGKENPVIVKSYNSSQSFENESEAYRRLQGSPYLPELFEIGTNYIRIEYLTTSLTDHVASMGKLPYCLAKQEYIAFSDMISKGVYESCDFSKRDKHYFWKDGQLKLIDYDYADIFNTDSICAKRFQAELDAEYAFLRQEDPVSKRKYYDTLAAYFPRSICDDFIEHMEGLC